MATAIHLLTGFRENWLVGTEPGLFQHYFNHAVADRATGQPGATIFLVERHPIPFLAGFLAACVTESTLVCCDPGWGLTEWHQVLHLIQPDRIWGDLPPQVFKLLTTAPGHESLPGFRPKACQPLILMATGGSSGQIQFAMHTWNTLMASVAGFQQYFQVQVVNSICVLPLYHVSGLMQCLRSLVSGGQVCFPDFKAMAAGELPQFDPVHAFLSLVPTQLQRLLTSASSCQWLTQIQTVLLGGAAAWPELLSRARGHQIPLAPTYGMTETASQIATLKPDDFLRSKTGCGQVLPHAQVVICDQNHGPLPQGQVGQITIRATSLALGYYPNPFPEPFAFQPGDLGYLDAQGYLHITGRSNHLIHTGGKKVHPEEVEAALRATGLVQDIYVLGLSDRHWGQVVSAVYVPAKTTVSPETLRQALANQLSPFKYPKYWLAVEQLPRNAQGKINRAAIVEWLTHDRDRTTDQATASVLL